MKQVAVLGTQEFVLGFQLAGVGTVFNLPKEHPDSTIREIMSNDSIGLVILQEESLKQLSELMQEQVVDSINPVFMLIAEEDTNEEMRKLIKKSIGVDLWDK